MRRRKPMFYVVWGLIVLLVVLHQDNWLWDDTSLTFGFLPTALAYHMALSLAAVVVWLLAIRFAWPLDEDDTDVAESQGNRRP